GIAVGAGEVESGGHAGGVAPTYVPLFPSRSHPAKQTQDVQLSYSNPHSITLTINGYYAYPAGPKLSGRNTDVIDTGTYQRVGFIGPSEDLLEVDFENGSIARVGNQYGVGRQL